MEPGGRPRPQEAPGQQLCRQIEALLCSQQPGASNSLADAAQRLPHILSLTIGHLEQKCTAARATQHQLAAKEQAIVRLTRVLESATHSFLGASTLPQKQHSAALLQQHQQQAMEAQQRIAVQGAGRSARTCAALEQRAAPESRLRMPLPTSSVPSALPAALSAMAAAAPQINPQEPLEQLRQEDRKLCKSVQALSSVTRTQVPPILAARPWLAAATNPEPLPAPTGDDLRHISARFTRVVDPERPGEHLVRLTLQEEPLPSLRPLIHLLRRRTAGTLVSARRRVWRQVCAARRPAAAAALLPPGRGCAAAVASLPRQSALMPAHAAAAAAEGQQGLHVSYQMLLDAGMAAQSYAATVLEPEWRKQRSAKARMNTEVASLHVSLRKAWREAKLKAQRERMAALRSNNVEEYMRLVQGAKNSKIDQLLTQTDKCLRQLTERLKLHNLPAAEGSSGTGASQGSPSLSGPPAAGGQLAALQQSNEAWNKLARAFQSDIPQQPQMLTGGTLREYQMQGLQWLVGLHDNGVNGILADEMGLGKTVQVISLVCHLVEQRQERRPFLIAAPASVLPSWERELRAWAPALKVVSYKGAAEERQEVFAKQMRGGRAGAFHVALTTYEYLMGKNDRPRLARVPWSYVIIDEGHRLKNSGCKLNAELRQYRAQHRLLLTGTPLQNRMEELWALLNFLMPTLFDSSDDFQTWFGGAVPCSAGPAGGGGDEEEDEAPADAAMLSEEEALIVTSRLHQVLRPFMLRRLKETVASELPKKVERLVPCQPSAYQRALFSILETQLQAAQGKAEGRVGIKGVNNTMMEMRNVCNHPLISRLHAEGAEAALPPHPLPAEVRLCGKLEVLDRILAKLHAGGHRVLLFCTMTRLLDVLEDYLAWRGFTALRMDGATSAAERGELVARFNAPDSEAFIFLLSIRAGGVGLNLQSADTVIMYDTDYNPQADLQAQARAHRLGQSKEVLVLRLKTVGTVEERIISVASDKRSMADRSITGGFFDGKTSAAERQAYLLDVIRSSQQQAQRAGGSGDALDGQLSDEELNQLLARGDEELKLFAEEDRKLQAAELGSWRGMGGMQASYSRLAPKADVRPLAEQALALARPVEEDAGREFGRGKRDSGDVSYRDLGEREFKRLCRDGAEGAVKLLGEPSKAAAATARAGRRAAAIKADPPRQQQQQQQQQPDAATAAVQPSSTPATVLGPKPPRAAPPKPPQDVHRTKQAAQQDPRPNSPGPARTGSRLDALGGSPVAPMPPLQQPLGGQGQSHSLPSSPRRPVLPSPPSQPAAAPAAADSTTTQAPRSPAASLVPLSNSKPQPQTGKRSRHGAAAGTSTAMLPPAAASFQQPVQQQAGGVEACGGAADFEQLVQRFMPAKLPHKRGAAAAARATAEAAARAALAAGTEQSELPAQQAPAAAEGVPKGAAAARGHEPQQHEEAAGQPPQPPTKRGSKRSRQDAPAWTAAAEPQATAVSVPPPAQQGEAEEAVPPPSKHGRRGPPTAAPSILEAAPQLIAGSQQQQAQQQEQDPAKADFEQLVQQFMPAKLPHKRGAAAAARAAAEASARAVLAAAAEQAVQQVSSAAEAGPREMAATTTQEQRQQQEEPVGQPPNPPTKRGPGRPRKNPPAAAPEAAAEAAAASAHSPAQQEKSQEEAPLPAKRGPGRPRKHPLPAAAAAPPTQAAAGQVPDQPIKRGPGRPHKHPLPAAAAAPAKGAAEQMPNQHVKRGPGRPRKHPLPAAAAAPTTGASEQVPDQPIKRGPGRPRKHPLPAPPPQSRGGSSPAEGPAAVAVGAAAAVAGGVGGGEELVGLRLDVFWPDDNAWYSGTVTSRAGRKHKIEYDDGDVEVIDLSQERVRFLQLQQPAAGSKRRREPEAAPAVAAGTTEAKAAREEQQQAGQGRDPGLPAAKRGRAGLRSTDQQAAAVAASTPAAPSRATSEAAEGSAAPLSSPMVLRLLGVGSVEAGWGRVQRMSKPELQELHDQVFGHKAAAGQSIRELREKLGAAVEGRRVEY